MALSSALPAAPLNTTARYRPDLVTVKIRPSWLILEELSQVMFPRARSWAPGVPGDRRQEKECLPGDRGLKPEGFLCPGKAGGHRQGRGHRGLFPTWRGGLPPRPPTVQPREASWILPPSPSAAHPGHSHPPWGSRLCFPGSNMDFYLCTERAARVFKLLRGLAVALRLQDHEGPAKTKAGPRPQSFRLSGPELGAWGQLL